MSEEILIDLIEQVEQVVVEITEAKDSYEIWLSKGNTGTRDDFLEYYRGLPGEPANSIVTDNISAQVLNLQNEKAGLNDDNYFYGSNEFDGAVHFYNDVTGITPSTVGLGFVNNTSDVDKPVSTAQQTALISKANLEGGNNFAGNQSISGTVSSGSIGIGASPNNSYQLDVSNATRAGFRFVSGSRGLTFSSFSADTNYLSAYGASFRIMTTDANPVEFYTTNTRRMNISAIGNVSVGANNANIYKLDVDGTFNVSGDTTLLGSTLATGKITANGQGALSSLAANDVLTKSLGDSTYGSYRTMRNLVDIDIAFSSLTPIEGMSLTVEANSVYELSGIMNIFTAGGSPTTNRMITRLATTGTFVGGGVMYPLSNGNMFPPLLNNVANTNLTDFTNIDRAIPIFGTIVTGTAGTLTLNGWKVGGSSTPKLLANSIIILRKIA